MEGQHDYEMVDNQSYTIRNNTPISTDNKTLEVYSTVEEAVPKKPISWKETNSDPAVAKTPSKVSKCSVAAVVAVCVVVLLAAGSIIIALMTHFNTKSEDSKLSQNSIIIDMQTKITELTRELNVTKSQLNEIVMGVNQTGSITAFGMPGKKKKRLERL